MSIDKVKYVLRQTLPSKRENNYSLRLSYIGNGTCMDKGRGKSREHSHEGIAAIQWEKNMLRTFRRKVSSWR